MLEGANLVHYKIGLNSKVQFH